MTHEEAYRHVRKAIRDGVLVRPEFCQKCGCTPGRDSAGRLKIQAHHPDYTRPLAIEWLCCQCHRDVTPKPWGGGGISTGEANGQAKLTWDKADEIRNSPLGCIRLARIYGVDKKVIQRIRRNESWKK